MLFVGDRVKNKVSGFYGEVVYKGARHDLILVLYSHLANEKWEVESELVKVGDIYAGLAHGGFIFTMGDERCGFTLTDRSNDPFRQTKLTSHQVKALQNFLSNYEV